MEYVEHTYYLFTVEPTGLLFLKVLDEGLPFCLDLLQLLLVVLGQWRHQIFTLLGFPGDVGLIVLLQWGNKQTAPGGVIKAVSLTLSSLVFSASSCSQSFSSLLSSEPAQETMGHTIVVAWITHYKPGSLASYVSYWYGIVKCRWGYSSLTCFFRLSSSVSSSSSL